MIAAVVLAAGAASRFGSPKQEVLLPHVLRRVHRSRVDRVVVVLGAHDVDVPGEQSVSCPEWELGPGASLRCGLSVLTDEVEAAVVCLADGPLLAPEAIDRVVEAWRAGTAELVAASYGGLRSHPVVIGRAAWARIPDDGGRSLPAALVACDDLGAPADIDTPADLAQVEDRL